MALAGFKKKLFTQIGIAIGSVILLVIFIVLVNSDINKRVESIEQAKGEIALRIRTIELLTGTNSDLKRAEPLFARMQTLLPTKDQLINFPRELQQAARNYALELGFSFGAERLAVGDTPGAIKFTMTAAGDYDNIVDFLRYVEQHRYLISLDSVDTHRSTKDSFSFLTSGEIFTK